MDELCYLSAAAALGLFERRELAPTELMEAVIARAEATEPAINALCTTYFDAALDRAREATERYAAGTQRALEGLPVAIKEETDVADQRTTSGSLIHADDPVATHTDVVAQRILDAGGIVHARSTAPEYSCAPFTHSRIWGSTRNPWNRDFNAGGSSGGSAAALAAGSATLASGSDIGGSIRLPASACGVVGFKPPYGRVPETPPYNLDHYCHEGPLARTVADCALFENVLAGPHPSDVVSLRPKLEIPAALDGIRGWSVAVCVTLGDYAVDDDVAVNTLAAAEALRAAGAHVHEVELPWRSADVIAAARTHFAAIFAPVVRAAAELHRDLMTTYALAFADDHRLTAPDAVVRGLTLEGELYAPLGALLEEHDVLLCPTMSVPALDAEDDYVGHGPRVNGALLDDVWESMMTLPFNVASRCPVLNVPSGFAANGVPTGLQIVGRTYDDVSVFRAGAALEQARPWNGRPL